MLYRVKTGKETIKAEADNPLEAAAVRVLVGLGEIIEVLPPGVRSGANDAMYVSTASALKKAAEMMEPAPQPDGGNS
jgi:hypothetical protein